MEVYAAVFNSEKPVSFEALVNYQVVPRSFMVMHVPQNFNCALLETA